MLQKVLFVIFLKKGDKTLHKKLSLNLVEHFWRVFTWEFMKFQKTLRQKTLCELKEYPKQLQEEQKNSASKVVTRREFSYLIN